jgi:hypothetical protein
MSDPTGHPDDDQLARFAAGLLDDAPAASVAAHLAACDACGRQAEMLPQDELPRRLRAAYQAGLREGFPDETPAPREPAPAGSADPRRRRPPGTVRDDGRREVAAPFSGGETELPEVPGYEILGELGRGGMGVVYQARQKGLGRLVALKMILHADHAGPADRRRFRAEAEAVAHLQHPHLVQIFEVGEHGGRPFYSLEFCPGGSLERKLAGTPLPPREAASLVESLARAMHAAHRAGFVHRDLKPANILLTADGTPKVTDFGLARRLDAPGSTRSGAVLGTPSYMAPEQAAGQSSRVGPAADVYALGAILYECLTGRPPFKATTALETLRQVLSDEPASVRLLAPKTPSDLETICLKCLHKDPRQRYAAAEALADDLRRWLDGRAIQARPVGRLERAWRWCRRNPAVAALLLAVALAMAAGTAVASYFEVQASRTAEQLKAALRERDEARDRIRRRAAAIRLVRFMRENPLLAHAKSDRLIEAFLKANPDLSWDDLTDAFPAVPKPEEGAAPEAHAAVADVAAGSFAPNMIGD